MCGLVGIISSNMLQRHKSAMSVMLFLDTLRGQDATGVATIRQNKDTEILKSTVPGYEFIEGSRLSSHLINTDYCWIGHNRFGTIGRNTKQNAHPFMVLNDKDQCTLVGAHNGTLRNKYILKNNNKFETDSEALFNDISQEGLEETISKLEGAWALSFVDHTEGELRFLRNEERPLSYAFEEDGKTMIWASEPWILQVACSKHDIKLLDNKTHSFEVDTLYKIPIPQKFNDKLEMTKKGGLVGKTSAFFQGGTTTGQYSNTQQKDTLTERAKATTQAGTTTKSGTSLDKNGSQPHPKNEKLSDQQSNVTELDSVRKLYKGFGGKLISKAQIILDLKDGCKWCEDEPIRIDDRGYGWLAPRIPICAKCLTDSHPSEEKKLIEEFNEENNKGRK